MQSNLKLYEYKNTFDAVKQISKSEGILGLYRVGYISSVESGWLILLIRVQGYGATIASFGPYSALYFYFYETFKSKRILNFREVEWDGVYSMTALALV